MKRLIPYISILILSTQLLVVLFPSGSIAQEKESYIKAILIYKFIPFIRWPADKTLATKPQESEQEKKTICTIGHSDVGMLLELIAEKRKRNNYIVLKEIPIEEISKCNVLYVANLSQIAPTPKTRDALLNEIIMQSRTYNILTISDMEYFIKRGGMIGFVNKDGKIKFEINILATQDTLLSIEAILLELAVKIYR